MPPHNPSFNHSLIPKTVLTKALKRRASADQRDLCKKDKPDQERHT